MKKEGVVGYISVVKDYPLTEAFKGEVSDKQIKWPKELGTEHPFEFEDMERCYKKFGLLNGIINKITNAIVGEFTINSKNPNVLALVEKFIKDNNFRVVLREWVREGLVKGNGFMEIDLEEGKVRVINANNMYVVRNKYGELLGYNQYVGDINRMNLKKIIPFKTNQIAHLKINPIAGEAYALGIVFPNEKVIENMILTELDSLKLHARKAGAPIHVKIGIPGEVTPKQAIDDFSNSLKYMNNRTEWVTDANTEMKIIEFGEIGKNLNSQWRQLFEQLIAGVDIPEVMLNSGQLNEGIARVQRQTWQSGIVAYQDMIENIIVENIFNPWLVTQKQKSDLDFVWNLPGEEEVNARIEKLSALLSNIGLTENLKRMIELEIARLLNIQDAEKWLLKPDDDGKERESEKDIQQPEVPNAKNVKMQESINFAEMKIKDFINLKEIKGFNYTDYLIAILNRIKTDKFDDLKAITEKDYENGLLSESEINKLRSILKEGFKENQAIREIELNIKERMNLRDRIKEDGAVISANTRPEMIARTETIRLANEGIKDLFKDNNVEQIRWIAAYSDRTCEYCMGLDGKIININESFNSPIGDVKTPPLHVNCRCSLVSE